jgi:hypothetical protein
VGPVVIVLVDPLGDDDACFQEAAKAFDVEHVAAREAGANPITPDALRSFERVATRLVVAPTHRQRGRV